MSFSARLVIVMLSLAGSLAACGESARDVGNGTESGTGSETSTAGTDTETETGDPAGEEGESGEESGEETGGGEACGNGTLEFGEACEGDNLDGQDCEDLGFVGGELACSDQCMLDATGCTNSVCGNDAVEESEECDGQDLGGLNCTDLGFGPGLPLCTDSCTYDTSTCPTLGEGDACSGFNPCENDLSCVSGNCYDGSPGDPCDIGGNCQSGDCEGATLFQDGVCT
jgi:hypothetical protein